MRYATITELLFNCTQTQLNANRCIGPISGADGTDMGRSAPCVDY